MRFSWNIDNETKKSSLNVENHLDPGMSGGILNHCETGPFSEDAYDQSLLVRTLVVHQSCFPADGARDRGVWVEEAHLSPILISSSLSGVSCKSPASDGWFICLVTKRLYLAGLSCRFSFDRVFVFSPQNLLRGAGLAFSWTLAVGLQVSSPSVVGLVFLLFCLSSGGAPFVALLFHFKMCLDLAFASVSAFGSKAVS